MHQGQRISQVVRDRIKHLLATTELSFRMIGQRTGVSSSAVLTINREAHIREDNNGRRWHIGSEVFIK